jgi:DNA-binding GntR family transcriptional regulator
MATFSIDRDSPIPYSDQIEDWLYRQIASGALNPATRSPARSPWASRINTHQAYANLAGEGLLVARPRLVILFSRGRAVDAILEEKYWARHRFVAEVATREAAHWLEFEPGAPVMPFKQADR